MLPNLEPNFGSRAVLYRNELNALVSASASINLILH